MYVEGGQADGQAVTRNIPVLVGGVDASSNVQTLKLATDGSLAVSSATEHPMVTVGVELTRPADTTAYAALDALSDSTSAPTVVYTFAGMATANAGNGIITKVRLMTDQKTCVARFRLHLFDTAPTAINDNSPYLTLYANRAVAEGTIDLPACATEDPTNSTAAVAMNNYTRLPYVCATADTQLYGLLETLDAFTPASGQKIFVQLTAEQG